MESCKNFEEMIYELLDDECENSEELFHHLQACSACRANLESWKQLDAVLKDSGEREYSCPDNAWEVFLCSLDESDLYDVDDDLLGQEIFESDDIEIDLSLEVEPPTDSWQKFQTLLSKSSLPPIALVSKEEESDLDVQLSFKKSRPQVSVSFYLGIATAAAVVFAFFQPKEEPKESLPTLAALRSAEIVSVESEPKVMSEELPSEEIKNGLQERKNSYSYSYDHGKVLSKTLARMDSGSFLAEQGSTAPALVEIPEPLEIGAEELDRMAEISVPSGASFLMDVFPVTNQEYEKFVKATGRKKPFHWDSEEYVKNNALKPVTYVSFEDADAYCRWEQKHLPTESQWELAAGGKEKFYPWGNDFSTLYANTKETGAGLSKIGAYPLNKSPFGVYDMIGNIRQWTSDEPPKASFPGQFRILKGGSWLDSFQQSKINDFFLGDKDAIHGNAGIRCVKPRL